MVKGDIASVSGRKMESDATENAGCRSFVICPMQSIELARNGNDAVEMNAIDKNAGRGGKDARLKCKNDQKREPIRRFLYGDLFMLLRRCSDPSPVTPTKT